MYDLIAWQCGVTRFFRSVPSTTLKGWHWTLHSNVRILVESFYTNWKTLEMWKSAFGHNSSLLYVNTFELSSHTVYLRYDMCICFPYSPAIALSLQEESKSPRLSGPAPGAGSSSLYPSYPQLAQQQTQSSPIQKEIRKVTQNFTSYFLGLCWGHHWLSVHFKALLLVIANCAIKLSTKQDASEIYYLTNGHIWVQTIIT